VTAKGDVGRVIEAVHDATELLALGVEDVEPAGAAAVNVAGGIDLHAVGAARLGSAQVGKNAIGLAQECAVRRKVEGANMTPRRAVNVEHALVRRERDPVGPQKIIDQKR